MDTRNQVDDLAELIGSTGSGSEDIDWESRKVASASGPARF
jgi:hypothetical protein